MNIETTPRSQMLKTLFIHYVSEWGNERDIHMSDDDYARLLISLLGKYRNEADKEREASTGSANK